MVGTQDITQEITEAAIEGAKAAVQTKTVARAKAGTGPRCETVNAGPKQCGSTLKQHTFD